MTAKKTAPARSGRHADQRMVFELRKVLGARPSESLIGAAERVAQAREHLATNITHCTEALYHALGWSLTAPEQKLATQSLSLAVTEACSRLSARKYPMGAHMNPVEMLLVAAAAKLYSTQPTAMAPTDRPHTTPRGASIMVPRVVGDDE